MFHSSSTNRSLFCKEAVAWKHLRHPNILPLLGATLREHELCLISEWMDQGNIKQYLKRKENSELNRIELLVEVVDGLSYMHGLQVVHGNLKGANIYIKNFHVCIADFGVSTIARHESWVGTDTMSTPSLVSFTLGGNIRWMSPELLDPPRFNAPDPRPTKESDRFALGMVIYEVLCGKIPYDGWDIDRINDAILKGIRPYRPKAATHLGLFDELWDILQRCWDERSEVRPELHIIRACLDEVTPMWHARKHMPLISADDAASLYPSSQYSHSLSTSTPSRSPAPSDPSPSPVPSYFQSRYSDPQ
ncbi:kinase-like domain-containing protein [Thelephora terrestris]|uniref:Kinase-like domain-containing protein n=1 Tax=Thelephora terrestris TaxID=56493 RepID=A0A9P6HKP4_9AGAM|nr:kinase-like domain-containing protein [Thelephora terrestris]